MASIGPEAVYIALDCEGQGVPVTTAHLDDLIVNVLHSGRLVNDNLAAEDAVAQTQLPLAVVSESVQLAGLGHDCRVEIATLDP